VLLCCCVVVLLRCYVVVLLCCCVVVLLEFHVVILLCCCVVELLYCLLLCCRVVVLLCCRGCTYLIYPDLPTVHVDNNDNNTVDNTLTLASRGLEEPFFISSCAVVSVFVLAGNRLWFYILLMYLGVQ
jgi:hypothetical protein